MANTSEIASQNESNLEDEEVSDAIFTIPNVISFIRLLCIPVFVVLLFNGYNLAATLLFALAACTDFLDGMIARKTHTVSKLGQLLDPAVDRLLMIAGVVSLLIIGRLPLWIVIVVLLRDALLLLGGSYLLKRYAIRVPVIFPGKVATTLLFIGCAGLLLNMPLVSGLGIVSVTWLPGLCAGSVSWGIFFVYAGLIVGLFTTIYYIVAAVRALKAAKAAQATVD